MYIIYVLTSSHFTELTISVPQWTCGHLKRQPGPRELSITCRVVVKISEVIFITRRHSATVKLNHKTVKTNKQTCKYCTLKWERVILANCNPVRLESVAYLKNEITKHYQRILHKFRMDRDHHILFMKIWLKFHWWHSNTNHSWCINLIWYSVLQHINHEWFVLECHQWNNQIYVKSMSWSRSILNLWRIRW